MTNPSETKLVETPLTNALTDEAIKMGGTTWGWSVEERREFLRKLFDSHERLERTLTAAQIELRQAQERIGELEAAYQELDGDSKAEIDAWIDAEEREQKLKERCAELEKDAARYRWLKSLGIHDYRIELYKENGQDGKLIFSATPTMLDEVIDDAAASGPKEPA